MLGDPHYQGTWGQLARAVETGSPGAEEALGMPMWDYLDHNPEFGATFNNAMTGCRPSIGRPSRSAYDFTQFSTIVDIGGGHGQLLALHARRGT